MQFCIINFNHNNMKSVLITGGNKGIGLETVKQLSKKGLFVYLGSRDLEKGKKAVKELNEKGFKNITPIEIDVTNPESIASAKNIIETDKGKLDILINNAGISGVFPQNAIETDVDVFKEVYETNVYGVIRVTQAFIVLLKKSETPRIVNVSSGMGSLTLNSDSTFIYYHNKGAVYCSSKSALNMYTVNLAYDLRDTNFKINSVCPGYTKTDFTGYNGGNIEDAGKRIAKFALIDNNGPSGKNFCEEVNPETGEIPW